MTEEAKIPQTTTSKSKKWFRQRPKARFVCLPIDAVKDRRLKLESLKVLLALALHADKDGKCFPGRTLLAELTGIHPVNVSKATRSLVKLGWLTKAQRNGKSSIYCLKAPGNLSTETEVEEEDDIDAYIRTCSENGFDAID